MTLIAGSDGLMRCGWSDAAPDFEQYHDNEWGFPVADDVRLFEKICLESFQSGLSWRTILSKRENFRVAFQAFKFHEVAKYTDIEISLLLTNKGIVRHKGKIEAVINNAKRAIELEKEFGTLARYFWSFEPDNPDEHEPQTRSTSAESIKLSKDLKKRGWKFVGPTTVFAFMQAMGLINDHEIGCVVREKAEQARRAFRRP
jgi:DNA-3-methyladenine glycosylase I